MYDLDQSNKIEQTSKDTFLACANSTSRVIVIPARVKRDMYKYLGARGKSSKNCCLLIFSAGIYLLLEPYLPYIVANNEVVRIDEEYTGHNANIKHNLLRYAKRANIGLPEHLIQFGLIGKKSKAHELAWNTQRGRMTPDEVVKMGKLLKVLGK